MVEIDNAANIAGWMTYKELKWLAKQAEKHSKIVEIGSYLGRSTRALGENTKGVVYAIDDFVGPRDMNLPLYLRENLFETFMYALVDLVNDNKVFPVISDHATVRLDFSPDMVFIDGSHKYEDIKRDIQMWLPRIVRGGLICGHDYTNMADVRYAVKETVKGFKVARGTSIWYATV